MAQVSSNGFLNFYEFNLYDTLTNPEFALANYTFADNANLQLDSTELAGVIGTYTATDAGIFWDGDSLATATKAFYIAGDGFVQDANNNFVAGTVTALFFKDSSSGPDQYFYLLGTNVGGLAVQNAAISVGIADDIALLRLMLSGNDTITGSAFDDNVFGANGNDTLIGNAGNDSMLGDAGNDSLNGGSGNDTLNGGSGNDFMAGGTGNDVLVGGSGSDRFVGAGGRDVMSAGLDTVRDVFIFSSVSDSSASTTRDVISQFTAGTDQIDLRTIDASAALAGNQVFGYGGTTATANAVWYQISGTSVIVYGDTSGDALADFSVRLASVAALSVGDFLL